MKFILAQKKEMTQKFAPDGTVIPVTKVIAGPCVVTQVKNQAKDGYTAVQIGFGIKKKISKPQKGHLKDLGNFRYLEEFRITGPELEKVKVGDKITPDLFTPGDIVKVTGVSKGRGFQGVVKRHGFHGSPASHGHKDQLRMPGSIGAGGVQHVFKGKRMGGRMGGEQVTITNLKIVEVDPKNNEIFIKGAVPGAKNGLLLISGSGDLVLNIVSEPVLAQNPEVQEENKEEKLEPAVVAEDNNDSQEKTN